MQGCYIANAKENGGASRRHSLLRFDKQGSAWRSLVYY